MMHGNGNGQSVEWKSWVLEHQCWRKNEWWNLDRIHMWLMVKGKYGIRAPHGVNMRQRVFHE